MPPRWGIRKAMGSRVPQAGPDLRRSAAAAVREQEDSLSKFPQDDLAALSTEKVLQEQHIEAYERRMKAFASDLFDLRVDAFYLYRVATFPVDALAIHPDNRPFVDHLVKTFVNSLVVGLTRLTTDQGPDAATLVKFKNEVLEWVRPEHKIAFRERIRDCRFGPEARSLFSDIRAIRDAHVAHRLMTRQNASINVGKLIDLVDALDRLFHFMAFNTEFLLLPMPYAQEGSSTHSTEPFDVDRALGGIAATSPYMQHPMPEDSWIRREIQGMSQQRLEAINKWRKLHGLAPLESTHD